MRTVSMAAGVGSDAISKGTERVLATGLVEVVRPGKGTAATIYRLDVDKSEHILTEGVLRICSDLSTLRGLSKG